MSSTPKRIDDIPLTELVLHKQGIMHVKKTVKVEKGNSEVVIQFKTIQMNDILKSIQVDGTDKNTIVESITYDSEKEKDIHLPSNRTLTELLKQAKGTDVSLVTKKELKIDGEVLGIESFSTKQLSGVTNKYVLSILTDDGTMSSVDIFNIKTLKFVNEKFAQLLKKKKDNKTVSINVKSTDEGQITISYLQAAPVWKTTYRINIDDKGGITIRAWAIIDNTSDEDWINVKTTLVSGFPITFITPVYKSIEKNRRIVKMPDSGDIVSSPILEERETGAVFAVKRERKKKTLRLIKPKTKSAKEVGTFVEYELDSPLTVKRNKSTTAPIFEGTVGGSEVLIYSDEIHKTHPMACIEMKNTTDITLVGGPATILDKDGKYLGDSMIKTLVPNETDLFPFKLEQRVKVRMESDFSTAKVHEIKIQSGVLFQNSWTSKTTKYIIKSDKDVNMLIEHRFAKGFELYETVKPLSTSVNFIRFSINSKDSPLIVKERRIFSQRIVVGRIEEDIFELWLKNKLITEEVFEQLKEISDLYETLQKTKRSIIENIKKQKRLEIIQKRSRENRKILGDTEDERELKSKVIKDLLRTTKELELLATNLDILTDLEIKQEKRYRDKLSTITYGGGTNIQQRQNLLLGDRIGDRRKKLNKLSKEELINLVEKMFDERDAIPMESTDQELIERKELLEVSETDDVFNRIYDEINVIDEELKRRFRRKPFSTVLKRFLKK